MRWVLLTDDFPPASGGVATWTRAVARGLVGAGDEVEVFARARAGLGGEPYPVHGVGGPSFGRRGGWWLRWAARRALQRADAVLATSWPVATGLPLLDKPVHVVCHGSDLTRPPRSERAFRRVMGLATHRWAVSGWLADQLVARGFEGRVLPAPVDAGIPRGPSAGCRRWGLVARATPLKGGDRFLRLVAAAGVEGVILGDGPERPAWERLAREVGARAQFLGEVPREQVPDVLRTLDLAVLLPRTDGEGGAEGLGLALLEAAAVGVPVVGCRTGGVPEAVGPGLLLGDPDDPRRSAAEILAWWRPDRGEAQRAWLRAHHGVDRLVGALRAAAPGAG